MHRLTKYLFLFVLLLVLGGGIAVWKNKALDKAGESVPVRTAPVVEAVYATGTVEPVDWARLTTSVNGRVTRLTVDDGDAVTQNQVLLEIESKDIHSRIGQAEAELALAQQELERVAPLYRSGATSKRLYDIAFRNLQTAQAGRAALDQALEDHVIRAPMDGYVLRRQVELGEHIQAGEVALIVGKNKPLRIYAEVDEEDIPRIVPGQGALIKTDAFPEQALPATVDLIVPQGDPANKIFRVRLTLPDDSPLRIGMTVEVNIIVRRQDQVLWIPATAVHKGQAWVIEKDGKSRAAPLKTGITQDGETEVREGLSPTDQILRWAPQ